MARHHRFDISSLATVAAAGFGLCLLALPLACGSDSGAAGDDADSVRDDVPRAIDPPSRDEGRPPASSADPQPSAADDDADPAATDESLPESSSDESPSAPGASEGSDDSVSPVAAATFASCARREGPYGSDCDSVYVTMTRASPPRCVQLTIDNCDTGAYGRSGLPVDVPFTWQLSSATIKDSADECELGVYYPESTIVVDATGAIDLEGAQSSSLPTGVSVDVTLTPSSTADDTAPIEVVTSAPLASPRCEED